MLGHRLERVAVQQELLWATRQRQPPGVAGVVNSYPGRFGGPVDLERVRSVPKVTAAGEEEGEGTREATDALACGEHEHQRGPSAHEGQGAAPADGRRRGGDGHQAVGVGRLGTGRSEWRTELAAERSGAK